MRPDKNLAGNLNVDEEKMAGILNVDEDVAGNFNLTESEQGHGSENVIATGETRKKSDRRADGGSGLPDVNEIISGLLNVVGEGLTIATNYVKEEHKRKKEALASQVSFYGSSTTSFSFIFGLFQTNINIISTTNQYARCPSSIWCWDSNQQPSDCKSFPITSRPGLPPLSNQVSLY